MARVNVDSQALTDARFAVLATLMGSDDPDIALGRMIRVWMQCYERGTYAVTKQVIVALFRGATDAPRWLVEAELAEEIDGTFRIKGTKGRIEYLMKKRATAIKNGSYGGRPPKKSKKPTSVSDGNPDRGTAETPPAPAPAPAPALKDIEDPPTPLQGGTVSKTEAKTPPKTQNATDSRSPHTQAIKAFCDSWENRYKAKYPFNAGKDAAAVKWMLAQVAGDPAAFAQVVVRYLADDEPFVAENRHTIGLLRSQFARWLVDRPAAASRGKSDAVTDYAKRTALDIFPRKD